MLNRLTGKSYVNDASKTPSACYQYDSAPLGIGRLSNQWTQAASAGACPVTLPSSGYITRRSILVYDQLGRIQSEQQCTPSSCAYTPAYTYDLAGRVLTFTNGINSTPLTFTNAFSGAGRLQSLTSSWNDLTHPPTLFSTTPLSPTAYYPPGGLENATYGSGLTLNRTWDNQLRITSETDTGSAVTPATSGTAAVAITGSEQVR